MTPAVRPARGEDDLAAVRALCWDYRQHLIDHAPHGAEMVAAFYPPDLYARIMGDLPRIHARPKGEILVGTLDDRIVGCGMSYEQAPGAAELKRLFLSPDARGHGLGARLCLALVDQARADGYTVVRLDTMFSLTDAMTLYPRLGFVSRDAYYDIPEMARPIVRFFEKPL